MADVSSAVLTLQRNDVSLFSHYSFTIDSLLPLWVAYIIINYEGSLPEAMVC